MKENTDGSEPVVSIVWTFWTWALGTWVSGLQGWLGELRSLYTCCLFLLLHCFNIWMETGFPAPTPVPPPPPPPPPNFCIVCRETFAFIKKHGCLCEIKGKKQHFLIIPQNCQTSAPAITSTPDCFFLPLSLAWRRTTGHTSSLPASNVTFSPRYIYTELSLLIFCLILSSSLSLLAFRILDLFLTFAQIFLGVWPIQVLGFFSHTFPLRLNQNKNSLSMVTGFWKQMILLSDFLKKSIKKYNNFTVLLSRCSLLSCNGAWRWGRL